MAERQTLHLSFSPSLPLSVVPPCTRRHTQKKKKVMQQLCNPRQTGSSDLCKCKVNSCEAFCKGTPPSAQIHAATSHFSLSLRMPAGCDCTCLVPQPWLQLSSSSSPSPLHGSASLFTQLYFPCYLPPKSASLFSPFSLFPLFFPFPPQRDITQALTHYQRGGVLLSYVPHKRLITSPGCVPVEFSVLGESCRREAVCCRAEWGHCARGHIRVV